MTWVHRVTLIVAATICCSWLENVRARERQYPQWPSKDEQRRMVEKAKRFSALALDTSQPAVPLEQWLRETLGAGATLAWEVGDCDLKPEDPEPPTGHPMCIAVRAGRPDRIGLRLHLLVGTFKRSNFESPTVEAQSFMGCSSSKIGTFLSVKRLSDIPKNIETLSSTPECK